MDIYIVQQDDTIDSIAAMYGVTVSQLIIDNDLVNAYNLVPGQTIVIVYPSKTYIVQESDYLSSIASKNNVSIMQLLRNNPFLYERDYIYPGETLTISYNTVRQLTTNGFAYPFIKDEILQRTLPYMTFISVFNYRISNNGNVITYGDDTNIIQQSKAYGTMPLLMISSLSPLGVPDPIISAEYIYNKENQIKLLDNVIDIMRIKGYLGLNIVITLLDESNQNAYIDFLTLISNRLNSEELLFFITINPNITQAVNNIIFEKIDYESIAQLCYRLTFLQYYWGVNTGPPSPVSSITHLRHFMEYITTIISTDNISIGTPLIAYDWALPYIPNITVANSLTINSSIILAADTESTFVFDEVSKTPYFNYNQSFIGETIEHVVWTIDARTMKATNDLIIDYNLIGSGIWNIMIFYQQFWTMKNSTFDIVKLIPDQFS